MVQLFTKHQLTAKETNLNLSCVEFSGCKCHCHNNGINFQILNCIVCSNYTNFQGTFGWGENREDGKQGEQNRVKNDIFHCFVEERKQERQKIGGKFSIYTSVERSTLHKYFKFKLHFFFFLLSSLGSNVAPPPPQKKTFIFYFLGQ